MVRRSVIRSCTLVLAPITASYKGTAYTIGVYSPDFVEGVSLLKKSAPSRK